MIVVWLCMLLFGCVVCVFVWLFVVVVGIVCVWCGCFGLYVVLSGVCCVGLGCWCWYGWYVVWLW